MKFLVRPADVRAEREALLEVLIEEIDGWVDDSKFEWLYWNNPHGEARCWVLEKDGEILGVSTAFPRVVQLGERTFDAWVLGDFCIAKRLRSLGPAIQLQQAALSAVESGEVDACYDFPSATMMAVYRRLKLRASGQLVRMVHLLKADGIVERRLGSGVAAKGVAFAGNLLLASRAALAARDLRRELTGDESRLKATGMAGFGSNSGVVVRRDPDYLAWRYLESPGPRPTVLSLADTGSVVFHRHGDVVEIVDLCGIRDEDTLRQLILGAIGRARDEGAVTMNVSISDGHPWMDILAGLGFVARDETPFVVVTRKDGPVADESWFMLAGDRDQ